MPVVLRIVDESEYGPEPRDITVPNGATITIRRHRQGADVVVEPGKGVAEPNESLTQDRGATLAQFLALDSCARDVGGAELALLGRAGERIVFLLSNRELASLASAIGKHFGTPGSIRDSEVLARIVMLERRADQLSEPVGRPDLRDMGVTLVEKARARLIDAQAAKLEAETRDRHGPPPDDSRNPVQVEGWKAGGRSDLGIVQATVFDREERGYELTLPPAQAREFAEALLSGARFAETGRER